MNGNIAVLIGGVGGAKLASGLVQAASPEKLTFIVNTGDDFWHLGLKICPDLDTLMYTLAGLVNAETGWGVADDTTTTLQSLAQLYGQESWFRLGDKDLATHLLRTQLLRQGRTLTEVTACLRQRLGIAATLLPMCDADMPTRIDSLEYGELGFQEYFVKRRWRPTVKAIRYMISAGSCLSPPVKAALAAADLVLIAPSNPWLSIGPILAVPGMRRTLADLSVPVVAVTPIIAGAAVKGPTAKIMRELGLDVSAAAVAQYYAGLINGFIDDCRNEALPRRRLAQRAPEYADAQRRGQSRLGARQPGVDRRAGRHEPVGHHTGQTAQERQEPPVSGADAGPAL